MRGPLVSFQLEINRRQTKVSVRKTLLVCLFAGIIGLSAMMFPTAAVAGVGVAPNSLSFGAVAVNTTSSATTITVSNNGRQTISILQISSSLPEFVVTGQSLPLTLGAHASRSFLVAFRPDAAVTYNGTIVVQTTPQNGNDRSISVSGTGTSVPAAAAPTYLLSASANSLGFGNTLLGTSGAQTVSLTNAGTGSVNISQIGSSGAGFSINGNPGALTLGAGQSVALSVNFTPTAVGISAGSINVASSAANSTLTISLNGNGVQAGISVIPANVSFGSVTVGLTNTQTLTISNGGTATLSVAQAYLGGAGFVLSGLTLPISVPPGGTSAFTVGFTPTSGTNFSGSVTLVSNTPNSPLIIPVAGTGTSPVSQLTASSSALSFGSLTTGGNAAQSITLKNSGNSGISISQISETGPGFSIGAFPVPLTLAAGQSTAFSVTFAPTTTGSLSGSVVVTSNAANSAMTISLAGSGTAPVSHSVNLNWTSSASSAFFNVYRGSQSGGPYSRANSALVTAAAYTDTTVASGQTYFYVATEVDSTGAESVHSNEAVAIVP